MQSSRFRWGRGRQAQTTFVPGGLEVDIFPPVVPVYEGAVQAKRFWTCYAFRQSGDWHAPLTSHDLVHIESGQMEKAKVTKTDRFRTAPKMSSGEEAVISVDRGNSGVTVGTA